MMKSCCWILITILSVFVVEAFSKDWNGIKPRISTRRDVEKILEKGESKKLIINTYKYKKDNIIIQYSKNNFDSSKDIVERIDILPYKTLTLTNYIRKIVNFQQNFKRKEVNDGHVVYYLYTNSAEGFEINVQKDRDTSVELIYSFAYFSPRKSSTITKFISF